METQLFGEANSSSFALEASRSIKNKVESKKLYFHEMPKNKEYPSTLDLRQRWIKN